MNNFLSLCPQCNTIAETKPLFHLLTFEWCPNCKDDIEILRNKTPPKKIAGNLFAIGNWVQYMGGSQFPELAVNSIYEIIDPNIYNLLKVPGYFTIQHNGNQYSFSKDSGLFVDLGPLPF